MRGESERGRNAWREKTGRSEEAGDSAVEGGERGSGSEGRARGGLGVQSPKSLHPWQQRGHCCTASAAEPCIAVAGKLATSVCPLATRGTCPAFEDDRQGWGEEASCPSPLAGHLPPLALGLHFCRECGVLSPGQQGTERQAVLGPTSDLIGDPLKADPKGHMLGPL